AAQGAAVVSALDARALLLRVRHSTSGHSPLTAQGRLLPSNAHRRTAKAQKAGKIALPLRALLEERVETR
ncbi:MAG: hypothetical protein NTV94_11990, partial [Planctomycetota bacterium]|nr:hypothetical protein [Planctomycetota bacterium]